MPQPRQSKISPSTLMLNLCVATSCLVSLSGCVPVLFAGSSVSAVTIAAKEKGVSGTISDSQISTAIKMKIYQKNQDIHRLTGVLVQNGEVLLTGGLSTQQLIDDVEEIAWSVDGVRKVINEMIVSDDTSMGLKGGIKDSWVTTQAKLRLVSENDVKSINYTIKTVDGVLYLTGIAQSEEELHRVTEALRKLSGVKTVKSFVKICEKPKQKDDDDDGEEKEVEVTPENAPDLPAQEVA